jgi:cytochrome c biogenesis protein CcmG, thiol:disulfide interchange protein DsbE
MTDDIRTGLSNATEDAVSPRRPHMMFLLPAALFVVVAIAFAVGLTMNPKDLPSVLIGKSVPEFDLPPVEGRQAGLSNENLVGEVTLVNVFASWCTACRAEHPLLMRLASNGLVPVHGLNYKDKPKDARKWLDDLGDPYTRTGADLDGRVAIEWGVYGVPETYVVDQEGKIAYKKVGPITSEVLKKEILPLVKSLRNGRQ